MYYDFNVRLTKEKAMFIFNVYDKKWNYIETLAQSSETKNIPLKSIGDFIKVSGEKYNKDFIYIKMVNIPMQYLDENNHKLMPLQ